MLINKNCPLVLSDLFYYDMEACNYNLLKYSNHNNVKDISYVNKSKRNIQIGMLQKHDNYIKIGLNTGVEKIINNICKVNKISENEIIVKAKDGFITKKKINYCGGVKLKLKKITKLILDVNKKKCLLIYHEGKIDAKGLINKPDDVTFLYFFNKLYFNSYNKLLSLIEDYRQQFFQTKNISYFTYSIDQDNVLIPIKDMGKIKVKKLDLNVININDIDKKQIWDEYVWPFCQAILIYYHHSKRR